MGMGSEFRIFFNTGVGILNLFLDERLFSIFFSRDIEELD
jgi:hypothetical protein